MNADIEFHIRENYPFSKLPANIRQLLGDSQREYEKQVLVFSIRNQLRYKGNIVRMVKKDEKRYYEELLQYSREQLMLFPYHLSDVVVKGMRVTPFQYYCNIVQDLMEQERSYDSLPNFTAADCLRLLGIGRNQYIDLMNQCRSAKKFFRKKPVRELLPSKPMSVNIESWWIVQVGYITEDDIKLVCESEKHVIDEIIDEGPARAGDFSAKDIYSLYRKGLIYLDVRINDDDFIIVPPLEGFVMNRVLGDYFETLLYKIFVSIDEHTPVKELANILQIDLQLVKNAVSMYCRLGFARLKTHDADFVETHPSWIYYQRNTTNSKSEETPNTEDPVLIDWNVGIEKLSSDSMAAIASESLSVEESDPVTLNSVSHTKKIAFLFDSTLTAFLMMGNLSPGLKSHAVTMFEVGKLPDESLDSLVQELDKIADVGEGEAQRYYDHALTLHSTISFLRHNRSLNPDADETNTSVLGLDLIRCESLQSLDAATCSRLLNKNYALLVSMAPLSNEIRPVTSCSPPHVGPAIPEVSSVWFKLFVYYLTKSGPPSLLLVKGTRLRKLPKMFQVFDKLLVTTWGHDPGVVPTSNVLLTLNDALTHSAVLVQGYSLSNEGKIVYQPFPFEEKEKAGLGNHLFCSHPAVESLSEHVDLKHSCGYLTMLSFHPGPADTPHQLAQSRGSPSLPVNGFKDDSSSHVLAAELDALDFAEKKTETPAPEETVTSAGEKPIGQPTYKNNDNWVLLDCSFGIPLFDASLNEDVCRRIASHSLCSRSNLQELTQFNRRLALHLLCFIAELQGTKPLLEIPFDGAVAGVGDKHLEADLPFPVHNFSFFNGNLQRVENWSEC